MPSDDEFPSDEDSFDDDFDESVGEAADAVVRGRDWAPGVARRVELPPDFATTRVDKALADLLTDVTRAEVQRWIEEGRVRGPKGPLRAKDRVSAGLVLEVEPALPPKTAALPDAAVVVNVLYEDAHLVVVSKPAGLVVHPGRGHQTGTLVNGLLARPGFERPTVDPRDPAGQLRPGIVHRIDKDTSGILVVAKTDVAREGLKEQFATHSIERVYRALTVGVPKEGTIETLHGRDPLHRLRFSSQVTRGKRAMTHVKVLESLAEGRAAFVECRLETGRTHQIRVHLSVEAKTPLLADDLYGGLRGSETIAEISRELGRQALHAAVLGFVHPITKERMHFEEPLPADMVHAIARLHAL